MQWGDEMTDYEQRHTPSPRRLYRDKERGVLCGVCAGLADYFGMDLAIVRVLAVVGFLFFMPATLLTYIVLCFIVPVKPTRLYRDERDESFWRGVRVSPQNMFSGLRHRFREMDARLQRMERYVTSSRYNLDREFENLKD